MLIFGGIYLGAKEDLETMRAILKGYIKVLRGEEFLLLMIYTQQPFLKSGNYLSPINFLRRFARNFLPKADPYQLLVKMYFFGQKTLKSQDLMELFSKENLQNQYTSS